jgi:hypothetical protein
MRIAAGVTGCQIRRETLLCPRQSLKLSMVLICTFITPLKLRVLLIGGWQAQPGPLIGGPPVKVLPGADGVQ